MDWFQVVADRMLVCRKNGSKHQRSVKASMLTNWVTVNFSRTVFYWVIIAQNMSLYIKHH